MIGTEPRHDPLAAPASLGKAGAELWQSIHRDYVIEDSGGHQMLLRICEACDSLASYDEQIERDGPTIRSASGLKEHPLLKVQLATRSFIPGEACTGCRTSMSSRREASLEDLQAAEPIGVKIDEHDCQAQA